MNRRRFLKVASAAGAALGITGIAARTRASVDPNQHGGPVYQAGPTAEEMDKFHEDGVKIFLDNIGKDPEFWSAELQPTLDGDVKVYDITCTEGPWEPSPGQQVNAMMYNGRVPGATIRVTEGDTVRINVTNNMTQSTAVHFHGVHTPNSQDGVPYITQPPIRPGETFTYEFVAPNPGSHMYHSHHNAAEQVTRGLMGAFIIEPKENPNPYNTTAEYIMILNDAGVGMTLNGRGFPMTQPIVAKKGDKIRVRYMNEGLQIHPMHLHGMYVSVVEKDGTPLPQPYLADVLNIAPGERFDVIVDCETVGAWAFHCHILTHAESSHGMFGMVTALVITE
jgi:manganese oxidase